MHWDWGCFVVGTLSAMIAGRWGRRTGARDMADHLFKRHPQLVYWEKLRGNQ